MKNWQAALTIGLVLAFPLALGGFYLGSFEKGKDKVFGEKEIEGWIQRHEQKIENSEMAILSARAEVLKHEEQRSKLMGEATELRSKLDTLTARVEAKSKLKPKDAPQPNVASVTKASAQTVPATASGVEAEAKVSASVATGSSPKLNIKSMRKSNSPYGEALFIPLNAFMEKGKIDNESLNHFLQNVDVKRGRNNIYVTGLSRPTAELKKLRDALKDSGLELPRIRTVETNEASILLPTRYLR